jgi:enoyl-CoA hydratase/carnithine racemase
MEQKAELEMELEGVSCSVVDNYGLLNIKCNVFKHLTDLQHDELIFSWIDKIERDKNLEGILFVNEPGCFGNNVYNQFLSSISGEEIDELHPSKITKFQNTQIRAIEVNMLMTFIKKFVNFSKIIVSGLRGEIVTPFIGLSLVTDFRLISESTFFNLSHVDYGLHPSGGLPFLLPKYIGQGKAEELLLRGGKISADESIKLGLTNEIINDANFMDECKKCASTLFTTDRNVVKSTKDLLFNYKTELYHYFDREANYLYA